MSDRIPRSGRRRPPDVPPDLTDVPPQKKSSAALRPQHPRPDLGATPDDPRTDFAACWARVIVAWHLASDPQASIELTVDDLRVAALELFSAGLVHHAAVARRLVDELAKAELGCGCGELSDTDLDPEPDCSGMT